jgi:hypothetical protein
MYCNNFFPPRIDFIFGKLIIVIFRRLQSKSVLIFLICLKIHYFDIGNNNFGYRKASHLFLTLLSVLPCLVWAIQIRYESAESFSQHLFRCRSVSSLLGRLNHITFYRKKGLYVN